MNIRTAGWFLFAAMACSPARADFKSMLLDSAARYTGKTTIGLSRSGNVFIAGYEERYYQTNYFTLKNRALTRTALGFSDGFPDLAVDSSGNVHIVMIGAYRDHSDPADLTYIYDDGTKLAYNVLDSANHLYWVPNISINKNERPVISTYLKYYPDGTVARDLLLVTQAPDGKWSEQNLDSTQDEVAKFSGVAFDSKEKAHIAYINVARGRLHYLFQADSGWVKEDIGTGDWTNNGFFLRIGVDGKDRPHVVYFKLNANTIAHATRDSAGHWQETILDSVGEYAPNHTLGFVLHPNGDYAVAYRNALTKSLNLVSVTDGVKQITVVDSTHNTGFGASMSESKDGSYFISYADSGTGWLRLATNDAKFEPPTGIKPGSSPKLGARKKSIRAQRNRILLNFRLEHAGLVEVESLDASGADRRILYSARLQAGSQELSLAPASRPAGLRWVALRVNDRIEAVEPWVTGLP